MKGIEMQEDDYTVTSYGNGLAYTVRRTADGASFHLQGDDAVAFSSARDSMPEDVDFGTFLSMNGYDLLFFAEAEDTPSSP